MSGPREQERGRRHKAGYIAEDARFDIDVLSFLLSRLVGRGLEGRGERRETHKRGDHPEHDWSP